MLESFCSREDIAKEICKQLPERKYESVLNHLKSNIPGAFIKFGFTIEQSDNKYMIKKVPA